MKSKIALVSDIEIERQYFVDSLAGVDSVSFISEMNTLTSSKVINAGRIMAKENEVAIYGAIGDDEDATRALKDLQAYGFNTKNVQHTANQKTGQVLVITDKKGKSAISVFLGASDCLSIPSSFDGIEYLYTATSIKLALLYKVLKLAKSKSITTFLDVPNNQLVFSNNNLRYVDYLIPNRQEAGLLLEKTILSVKDAIEAARQLLNFGSKNVVITLDKDGCLLASKEIEPVHIPAPKVEAKDETGSGDIFRGVFVNNIVKGADLYNSAVAAIDSASTSVTIKGVDTSIRTILSNHENRN